jgi:hypothetical protein
VEIISRKSSFEYFVMEGENGVLVGLGSENPNKISGTKAALEKLFPKFELKSLSVSCSISKVFLQVIQH